LRVAGRVALRRELVAKFAEVFFRKLLRPENISEIIVAFVRSVLAGIPGLIDHEPREEGIFVKDGAVDPDATTLSKSLLGRAVEPAAKFLSALLILYLLVILKVITDYETRAATSPLAAANLLLRTTRYDSEEIAISAADNDFTLGLNRELLNLEVLS
jgi:hypothetical protein